MNNKGKNTHSWGNTLYSLGKMGGFGWFISLTIIIFTFIGHMIDQKIQTLPLFTILGILLGLLVSIIGMRKLLINLIKTKK